MVILGGNMFYYKKLIIKGKKFFKRIINRQLEAQDFRRPLTYYRDPEDERDYKFQTRLLKTVDSVDEVLLSLPSKVDHTPAMTPVKDQLYLGSCVGFAVTAMKEWQETKEHKEEVLEGKKDHRKGEVYDLSEAWVYWKCKEIDYWPDEEGTSIRFAMKVLNRIGVPKEKAWPYNDSDYGKPASWANMTARWNMIESYWRIESLSELKAALVERPIPIGVACFREIFYVGSDGIVPYPANPNEMYGGHAICAVGYDDSRKLIKFKNSWGPYWGQGGYGYLPYSYINDFMWDAWTCNDLSVTRDMLKGERDL
jgi:C1A family cysteine protease